MSFLESDDDNWTGRMPDGRYPKEPRGGWYGEYQD